VKPLECLLFMRSVKSRTYFEQMLGRGVRVIDDTDFQAVTDDAKQKDRFVVVDAVGVTRSPLADNIQPLDRKPTQNLDALFKQLSFGRTDTEIASTIAGRLARLDKRITREDREQLQTLADGTDLTTIVHQLVDALDPDQQLAAAIEASGSAEPSDGALAQAAQGLLSEALLPLTTNPDLRNAILNVRKSYEQTIDEATRDKVIFAGYSEAGHERAGAIVTSFKRFIEDNKDHIRALQVLYSRPYAERLTFAEIKELAQAIARPPQQWTPELLWRSYEMLDKSKVRGSGTRTLTDIVSLVRYALEQDQELVPFRDQVDGRFAAWLASQEQQGGGFTEDQLRWLTWMKESIASDMSISAESFEYFPYAERGGIGKAVLVFGDRLIPLMNELTQALAA
jgi:type I restriction enzyme, R subunit